MASTTENLRKFFTDSDTDKNGQLSFDELAAALRKGGYNLSDERIKQLFTAVDSNGDDQLSMDEFLVAMNHAPEDNHKEAALRRTFRMFDKDGNGEIDKNELKAVFKEAKAHLSDADIESMIKLADEDKSGTISYEEFIKYCFKVQ